MCDWKRRLGMAAMVVSVLLLLFVVPLVVRPQAGLSLGLFAGWLAIAVVGGTILAMVARSWDDWLRAPGDWPGGPPWRLALWWGIGVSVPVGGAQWLVRALAGGGWPAFVLWLAMCVAWITAVAAVESTRKRRREQAATTAEGQT